MSRSFLSQALYLQQQPDHRPCVPSRMLRRQQKKHDAVRLPGQLPAGEAHLQPRTVCPLKPAQGLAAQSRTPHPGAQLPAADAAAKGRLPPRHLQGLAACLTGQSPADAASETEAAAPVAPAGPAAAAAAGAAAPGEAVQEGSWTGAPAPRGGRDPWPWPTPAPPVRWTAGRW